MTIFVAYFNRIFMEQFWTLAILALAVAFFISGKIRSDIVALCALVGLIVTGILTPEEALSGFSSNALIMMIGLFVVGGAIFQTGLAKMMSSKLMKLAGNSETRLFTLVIAVTCVMGAFVSNTGTVAIMIPIVVSMAKSINMSPSRLLMPLAFASSMSGMMTLIGTPPNIIINEELIKHGFDGLGFFTFLPVGLICAFVGTLLLMPLSKKFLKGKGEEAEGKRSGGKSLKKLVNDYGVADKLHCLSVGASSPANNKKIKELNARKLYGINIVEVRRKEAHSSKLMSKRSSQQTAKPDTLLQTDDILYMVGRTENVQRFAEDFQLTIQTDNANLGKKGLDFYDIGVAEIVLTATSSIINKTIKDVGFRNKFRVSILGIRRHNKYISENLADEKIQSGDVLLVQGSWERIAELQKETDEWIVIGNPLEEATKVTLDYKAPIAAFVMIAMIAAMVFDFIPIKPVTAVIIAALLMVLCGCFRNVEAAYKTINWESIVLIGAMMPMSLALEKTGIASWISTTLSTHLGGYSPMLLLAGIYFATSLLTMFISNTATAVLMAPIAMKCALQVGVSPVPLLFAVTLGASLCFSSPFSTPPNALVMHAGQYRFSDYVKVGLPLQLILGIVMILVLPLLFPF